MKKLKLNICKYSGDKQVEKIGNVKNIAIFCLFTSGGIIEWWKS